MSRALFAASLVVNAALLLLIAIAVYAAYFVPRGEEWLVWGYVWGASLPGVVAVSVLFVRVQPRYMAAPTWVSRLAIYAACVVGASALALAATLLALWILRTA